MALYRNAKEIIKGYRLGGAKRGEKNVWLEGRILKTGNVSLVKVLPHTVSKGKRLGERKSTGAILFPETSMKIHRENQEKVRIWRAAIDGENSDRERKGAGYDPNIKSKALLINFINEIRSENYVEGGTNALYYTLNALAKHIEIYSGDSVRFADISREWVEGFVSYLKNDAMNLALTKVNEDGTKTERKLKLNTQHRLMKNLCNVLNRAVKKKYMTTNPINETEDKIKQEDETRCFLTPDEVRRLIDTPFTHSPVAHYNIKEAFLFACFSGLRYSDLQSLRKSDFHKEGDMTYIQIRMKKTKGTLKIYLPEIAMQFAEGYDEGEDIFYLPQNFLANKLLRKWAEDAKITEKHVTFHVARHSAATLMLSNGAPLATVQKHLGHKKASTTEIYAKILDDSQKKAVSTFDKIFEEK